MIGWIILAALVAVVGLILFTPIRVRLSGSGSAQGPDRVSVRLWGAPLYRWRRGEARPAKKPEPEPAPPPRSKTVSQRERKVGPLMQRLFGGPGRRLLRRMIRATSVVAGWARVELGFDDPADTGLAAAVIYPLTTWLGPDRVEIVPRFDEAVFTFDGDITFGTSVWRLSAPPVRFLFEPGAFHALRLAAFGRPKPPRRAAAV